MLRKCTILGLGGAMAILTVLSCVKKEPPQISIQTLNTKTTSSAGNTTATTSGSTGKTTSSATTSSTATTATSSSTSHTTAGTTATTATTAGSTTATTSGSTTATTSSTGTTATTGSTTSASGPCNPDQTNVLQLEGDINDFMYLGSVTASKAPNIYSIVATDNHMHWVTVTLNEHASADKTFKVHKSTGCFPSDTVACVKFIYNNMELTLQSQNQKIYYVADPDHPAVIFCGVTFTGPSQKTARVTGRIKLK